MIGPALRGSMPPAYPSISTQCSVAGRTGPATPALREDRDEQPPAPRPVELTKEDPLPRPQGQTPFPDGDHRRETHETRLQVGCRVALGVPVGRVVARDRSVKRVKHVAPDIR